MPFIGEEEIRWRRKHIWLACKGCGKKRWVRLENVKRPDFRGLCRNCHPNNLHQYQSMKGLPSRNWKGGRTINTEGYIKIYLPPNDQFRSMTNSRGYVLEHRLVIAKHLGKCLRSWEVIHHKNGIKDDNRLKNLQLLPSQFSHFSLENFELQVKKLEDRILMLEKKNEYLMKQIEEIKNKKENKFFVNLDTKLENEEYVSN